MDVMAYFVLAASGKVLICKSVWGLSKDDCNDLTVTLQFVRRLGMRSRRLTSILT